MPSSLTQIQQSAPSQDASLGLRGNVLTPACPSRAILNHVTSRWGVLVLIALGRGTRRFSQLRREIGGVSDRMLAQTLQDLAADGFVIRTSYDQVPPHVDYRLSELGQEVAARVQGLVEFLEENLEAILRAKGEDPQQSSGHPARQS